MSGTTTIEIYEEQKEWLDDFAEPGQSAKGAFEMLITLYNKHEGKAIDPHSDGAIEGYDADDLEAELQKLKELVERVPERTAEQLEGRFQ